MPQFYQCVAAWTRHSVGEIIPEHEYNKLPFEIKKHGNFVPIQPVVPPDDTFLAPVTEPQDTDHESTVHISDLIETAISVTVDPFIDDKPRHKFNKQNKS